MLETDEEYRARLFAQAAVARPLLQVLHGVSEGTAVACDDDDSTNERTASMPEESNDAAGGIIPEVDDGGGVAGPEQIDDAAEVRRAIVFKDGVSAVVPIEHKDHETAPLRSATSPWVSVIERNSREVQRELELLQRQATGQLSGLNIELAECPELEARRHALLGGVVYLTDRARRLHASRARLLKLQEDEPDIDLAEALFEAFARALEDHVRDLWHLRQEIKRLHATVGLKLDEPHAAIRSRSVEPAQSPRRKK